MKIKITLLIFFTLSFKIVYCQQIAIGTLNNLDKLEKEILGGPFFKIP